MTDAAGNSQGTFRIGAVISRGIGVYFRHFVPFVVVGIVTYLPVIVLTFAFGPRLEEAGMASAGDVSAVGVVSVAVIGLAGIVCWCGMSAGITYGVISSLRQGGVHVGTALSAALRAILPLLGLSLIGAGLGLLGGVVLVLLSLVPVVGPLIAIAGLTIVGTYLFVRWWVAVPAVVVDGLGPIAALRRSSELTAGYRWRVLVVLLLWMLIAIVVSMLVFTVIAAVFGVGGTEQASSSTWALDLVGWLFDLVLVGLGASVVAVGYHDLRIAKEGVGTDDIARVFD